MKRREFLDFSNKEYPAMLVLAHENKKETFARYAEGSLSLSGQVDRSDRNQMSPYPLHDHRVVDQATKAGDPGTDVITGVSVPRSAWFDVFEKIRPYFLKNEIDNVYGTFRMVGRDDETFLAWARERLACAIFTVHAEPTSRGLARLAGACRGTIDKAANRGGRYHLSYHRYASRKQVERCYPQFWSFCNRRRNRIRTRCFQAIGIDMPKNSLPIGNGPTDLDVTL